MEVLHVQPPVFNLPGPMPEAEPLTVRSTEQKQFTDPLTSPPGPPGRPPGDKMANAAAGDDSSTPGFEAEIIGIHPDGRPVYAGSSDPRAQMLLFVEVPIESDEQAVSSVRIPINGGPTNPIRLTAAHLRENRWPPKLCEYTLGLLAMGPIRDAVERMMKMGSPHHYVGRTLAGLGDTALAPLTNYLLGDRISVLTPRNADVMQKPDFSPPAFEQGTLF